MKASFLFGGVAALALASACGGSADSGLGDGGSSGTAGSGGGAGTSGSSGSAGTGGSSGTTGIPFDQVAEKYADAACNSLDACYGSLIELFLGGMDCKTITQHQVENSDFSKIQAAITDGTVNYDGAKMQACLDKVVGGGCDTLGVRDLPECIEAIDGTVASGGDCTYSFECKGNSFCKAGAACPGKCSALLAAGEACKDNDECGTGLKCSQVTQLCVKPAAHGEACEGGVAPQCENGLLCSGQDDKQQRAGTCKTQAEALVNQKDAPCDLMAGLLCADGLVCALQSIDNGGNLISKCASRVAAGAACNVAFPSQCPRGQVCDVPQPTSTGAVVTGTCKPLPKDGQPCTTALGAENQCEPYVVCANGTCKAMTDNGASCAVDDTCYSGTCVNGGCALRTACSP